MRRGKLTTDEIFTAEKAADDRRISRNNGYSLMKDRDMGAVTLSNGISMLWHVPKPDFPEEGIHVYPKNIPEDSFILKVGSEEIMFDTEEFRRWLRWA